MRLVDLYRVELGEKNTKKLGDIIRNLVNLIIKKIGSMDDFEP